MDIEKINGRIKAASKTKIDKVDSYKKAKSGKAEDAYTNASIDAVIDAIGNMTYGDTFATIAKDVSASTGKFITKQTVREVYKQMVAEKALRNAPEEV